jgi:transglutaminase-like putative cysteine protease
MMTTAILACFLARGASASDAPAWMHALVSAPATDYADKPAAVLLYDEMLLSVDNDGKIRRLERKAYKILRPEGESFGTVQINFDSQTRIRSLNAWCIPASGKDYAVKEKDAVETALLGLEDGVLATDQRLEVLKIPAAIPGSIVGYEVEQDERPYFLVDDWTLQHIIPTRQTRYSLQLPAGWSYKATWLNHPEVAPVTTPGGQTQWTLDDVPAIHVEDHMPPWQGIAGRLVVTLVPPSGKGGGLQDWSALGAWYLDLARGRRDPSPEIKAQVLQLTSSTPSIVEQMRRLAQFVQTDIRYVAIELGIGGHQPHAAADVFSHRYGDCKDKATLLSSMLAQIGIDSYYVLVNTERGSITAATPPNLGFNHAILAIRLPDKVDDASLKATLRDPKLGRLLIFDPTDDTTPFGSLRGPLQANYGMLITPDGGELVELPQLPPETNSMVRTAKLALDADGKLSGSFHEVSVGDVAARRRDEMRSVSNDTDQIRPIESLLAASLTNFEILNAQASTAVAIDKPFEWRYEIRADHYAKLTGDLLLVRPRVLGSKARGFYETKGQRRYAVEFDGPERDTDSFEIVLPPSYVVDDLPPPISVNYGFASYESKSEITGNTLRYTRTFEIRDVSVPVAKAGQLNELYRIILADEHRAAVFKRTAAQP